MPLATSRSRTDFYTNPTFKELVGRLQELRRSHTESVKAAGRSGETTLMTLRTGIVDGIEYSLKIMEESYEEATKPRAEEVNEPA
jgi:hypothetical protein